MLLGYFKIKGIGFLGRFRIYLDSSCFNYHSAEMASALVGRCQKKLKAPCEENSGFMLLRSLPDQMLLEILIRLPKKCATRYKVVCRRWGSLISSSHFISLFISHRRQLYSKDTPDSFTIVLEHKVLAPSPCGTPQPLYPVEAVSNHPELSEFYKNKSVNLNFLPRFRPKYEGKYSWILYQESEPISVEASCHDLLLCSLFNTFYIVNLLTRQWIALPNVPNPARERIHSPRCFVVGQRSGLVCYHDANHIHNRDGWYKFKVILVPVNIASYSPEIIQNMKNNGRPDVCPLRHNIIIFCSETRQWTEVITDWFPLHINCYRCYSPIISYDRMLYWLIGHYLVALDIFSGDAKLSLTRIITLPDQFVTRHSICFGVCVGRLRLACCSIEQGNVPAMHIWELEDLDRGTWSVAHKVVLHELKSRSYGLNLIAFHPFNRDVIFCKKAQNIYSCNMQTAKLTLYRTLKLDEDWKCSAFSERVVPPLLHQWFPTSVPSPPPGQET